MYNINKWLNRQYHTDLSCVELGGASVRVVVSSLVHRVIEAERLVRFLQGDARCTRVAERFNYSPLSPQDVA